MKFKVRSNPKKEWALAVEKEVTGFLQLAGWEAAENCEDMTIIIGGDGTIFHNKNGIEGAVFAIGGPQSKICQANEKNWKTRLGKVLAKPETETRVALSGKINGKDAGWAINDFVVHSRRHNYVEMNVSAAGRTVEFGGTASSWPARQAAPDMPTLQEAGNWLTARGCWTSCPSARTCAGPSRSWFRRRRR